jgi:hypothetical protein
VRGLGDALCLLESSSDGPRAYEEERQKESSSSVPFGRRGRTRRRGGINAPVYRSIAFAPHLTHGSIQIAHISAVGLLVSSLNSLIYSCTSSIVFPLTFSVSVSRHMIALEDSIMEEEMRWNGLREWWRPRPRAEEPTLATEYISEPLPEWTEERREAMWGQVRGW